VAINFREKKPGQRACDVKDAKGELCVGHLKRWYTPDEAVTKELGSDAEVYRCERCHALYRPVATDDSTAGRRFELHPVNVLGAFGKRSDKSQIKSDK
jgi:hypothetical protein